MSTQASFTSFSSLEIDRKTTFTSDILPILDYLSQIFLPFQSFEFIQIFFCVLQIIETSLWTAFGEYWGDSHFLNLIHYITFFSSSSPDDKENIILCCIFLSVIFINFLLFLFLYLHYYKTRRISRPFLIIYRLYFLIAGDVIIHPLASLMGNLVQNAIYYHKAQDIILLILTVIGYIIAEILFYINQKFVNQSIYIHKSLWITFDSTILMFFFIWNPAFLFLDHLFKFYPAWASYILIVVHIIIILLTFSEFLWLSCLDDLGNSIQASVLCILIFNGILRIILENYPIISQEFFVIISLILFVIITIVFYISIKIYKKKVNSLLSYSKLIDPPSFAHKDNLRVYDPTMEGKFVYFNELKLDKSIKKSMVYLIVGFSCASEMFTDFSLVQYCIENYSMNPKMLTLLIHLLAYFRTEKKMLDNVMKLYDSLRSDYAYGNFIYIQAHRIKVFRQVTSTNVSLARLNELKIQSKDLENQIKAFWTLSAANTTTLEHLEKQQRYLNYLWDESIEENWISESFREDHIRFLIESCTSFKKAVQMENIKEKIDVLKSQRNDLCVLSLLICFPRYFKKKIVDFDDNLFDKNIQKSSSDLSVNSQNEKLTSTDSEYDFTQDELIANSIMSYGKLRLSMENTLNNFKPKTNKILTFYSTIAILASLLLIIITFSILFGSFDSFNDWNREIGVVIDMRIAYIKSFLSLTIYAGKATNRFYLDSIACNKTIENDIDRAFLKQSTNFDKLSLLFVDEAISKYDLLIEAIVQLALKNMNISTLASILFDSSVNSTICSSGQIVDVAKWSLEKTLNFDILSFAILSEDTDIAHWYSDNIYWCHCITTFPEVGRMFSMIQNELTYDLYNSSYDTTRRITNIMIIIAPCHLLLFVIPLPIIIYFNSREINYLLKIMLSIEPEYKAQARKDISLSIINENNEIIPPVTKLSINWKIFIFAFLILLCFVAFLLFEELMFYFYKMSTNKISDNGFFSCYFSLLRVHLYEILINMLNAAYFIGLPDRYITDEIFKNRIYEYLKDFQENLYEIMNNTPYSPSSVGHDSIVDRIVLMPFCEAPTKFTNLHDSYECASLSRLSSALYIMVEKYTEELKQFNGVFGGEELSNLYHLIFVHLSTLVKDVVNRFDDLQNIEIKAYKINLLIFFICGIVLLLIWSILMHFIISNFNRIFSMAMCLIRRISPVNFINSNDLLNYILSRKSEEIEMGVTHAIFNNSFDGIICINLDGIVEIINKSFANDYGYSPEQLVGQLIGTIFDSASREKIENQLALIKSHESSSYKQDVTCFTNSGRAVSSFITLLQIKGIENSLILVIRDQTVLLQKKKRLELAKKQSQDLLEQIMPPKVLMMMKAGKSEITFSVPSASVMFVDIVNFSKFSADLSPPQIMGTLSTLFGAFDVWIQKYPLMTKIKLIGDTYMAACGLFASDEEPQKHAKQSIDFALRVLNILDDTNIKLNANLQIRIGINSDGPVIAGVLGTENRVFDIIGDTINVASRLEHKADPGHILMSEKTYELIKNEGYNIVPKGKVFLKGKGDMEAYSI